LSVGSAQNLIETAEQLEVDLRDAGLLSALDEKSTRSWQAWW
jgi:hypothetical protein